MNWRIECWGCHHKYSYKLMGIAQVMEYDETAPTECFRFLCPTCTPLLTWVASVESEK